ncbi:pyridoxamine 5'-phosphate oxidase family protein [Streptomyces sp. NPDC045251]|uniref:pyridoxamine 5'-phosphate oxidase family protein n=1 Tax=unclassified Streptomyces TaxID=2593676 RepID=UPI0033E99831
MTTTGDTSLARTRLLLDRARYLNLATVSPDGRPWAATLEYAWHPAPLRFVFGSARESRHGRDIAHDRAVSGTLFVGPSTPGLDIDAVDGAQFTGDCREVPEDELDEYHAHFYRSVFPDPGQRDRYRLPTSRLCAPAPHRLYLVVVRQWWLNDTSTWERDRIDRRTEVPAADLNVMSSTLDIQAGGI